MNLSVQGSTNPYASNPFANLNLTSSQQNAIQSILQTGSTQGSSFSQIQPLLSQSQQQTLQTDLQQLKQQHSGHHHHHGGGGGSSSATSDVLSPTFGETDGLTVAQLQNQTLAGNAIAQSQLQNTLLQLGSTST